LQLTTAQTLSKVSKGIFSRLNSINATTVSGKTTRACGLVTPFSNMGQAFLAGIATIYEGS
jgi:hypothetical protein